jgi:hypothetical protein
MTARGAARSLDRLAAGHVVVPPSQPCAGRSHTWSLSPEAVPLPDAPVWVVSIPAERATPRVAARDRPSSLWPVAPSPRRVSPRMRCRIEDGRGADPIRSLVRSEAGCAVAQALALVAASSDDATGATVRLDSRDRIGEAPRALGRRSLTSGLPRVRATHRVRVLGR